MVVTLQRTRPPQGTHERERFASGQDVNELTVERIGAQGKGRNDREFRDLSGPLGCLGIASWQA